MSDEQTLLAQIEEYQAERQKIRAVIKQVQDDQEAAKTELASLETSYIGLLVDIAMGRKPKKEKKMVQQKIVELRDTIDKAPLVVKQLEAESRTFDVPLRSANETLEGLRQAEKLTTQRQRAKELRAQGFAGKSLKEKLNVSDREFERIMADV